VEHRNTLGLARVEKANGFEIHEFYLFQVQSYWSSSLDLSPHLIKVLCSKLPA
jgi:hypothetical protein